MIGSGWMLLGALFCLLGTVALVAIAFVGLRWFADHGHAWWVWSCLAGAGLGVVGIWYVRRRRAAIRRHRDG